MSARLIKKKASLPTLQMIAERANLSRETVSHILGGKLTGRYRKETQARVIEIARALNYRPHRGAQIMKSGRSNLIAIVHFGVGLETAHSTNLALSRKVSEAGFDYLALDMNWYGGSVERTVEELIRARVEGILISHIQEIFKSSHIDELINAGIPVVAVNGEPRSSIPLVCDNVIGAFQALTSHLIENGHRLILHLVPQYEGDEGRFRSVSHRTKGFRQGIEQQGKWQILGESEFFEAWPLRRPTDGAVSGITIGQDERHYHMLDRPVYKFCRRLFQKGPLPDAIVCSNDFFAMEAIAAALECGVAIPGDLAVTGHDNDRIGAYPAFGITTAEQNIEAICSKAVEILMRQVAEAPGKAEPVMFDSTIILRTSSGKATPPIPSAQGS